MRESMARLLGAVPGAVGRSGRAVCTVVVLASALAACGGTSKGGETTGRRASTIEVVSGDAQTGVAGDELPAAVVVRVRDSSGLPVPGQLINFHVVAGGGGVFAGAALSDANGVARERWTLGTVTGQPQRLEAAAVDANADAAIVFASFNATAISGPAATATAEAGNNQRARVGATLPVPVQVKVVDKHGNGAPGVSIDFVVTAGTGSTAAASAVTDALGSAVTAWTLGTVYGPQALEARAPGLPPVIFVAVQQFVATLVQSNEPPIVQAVPSTATGSATVRFEGTNLIYSVRATGLTSPPTLVLIHLTPASTAPAQGAAIVALRIPNAGVPGTTTVTADDITANPPDAFAKNLDGTPMTFDDLVQHIKNGETYVNIHTQMNPGGEIRGDLQ